MLPVLADENFNHRILRGLRRKVPHLDLVIAQVAGLKGAEDPPLLDWAAEHARVLLTHDLKTIPKFAYEQIKSGWQLPGVIAVPDSMGIGLAIEELALIVEACQPSELENLVIYLPL